MLGEGAAPGQVEQLRHALGLDQRFTCNAADISARSCAVTWGNPSSFRRRCHVIFERYPATLQLAFLALLVCAAIAIPSGMLAAAVARRPTALAEGVLSE